MTRLYGIIGHPVGHTLSPVMHNAAFERLKIDAEYKTFDIEPRDLGDFLSTLAERGISGINVTIPHKIEARRYIEKSGILDKEAIKLGAVNTVNVEGKTLKGYNTDGAGFYRSLVMDLKFEPEGKTVFVLGAGGAATAIVMYLGTGPKKIFVMDEDASRAGELAARYKTYFKSDKLSVCRAEELEASLMESDLFVNATPIGMKDGDQAPVDVKLMRQGRYLYDLVYNFPQTALVKAANARKIHAATGIGMLLCQGAIAFEIWTGLKAPVDVVKRALVERFLKVNAD